MRITLFAFALLLLPTFASATTIVVEGGGPYNVTSDNLFSGIVVSSLGGAGTYTADFFSPGISTIGAAEAAVTISDIDNIFTGLSMTWLGAETPITLVISAGLNDLSTIFETGFLAQSLQFSWTDSVQGAGFGYDVITSVAAVPLPASALLLFGALGGLGLMRGRRKIT